MQHQRVTLREEAVRLKTVLRAVASLTPRGTARADRSVIMLAYAALGMHFPGKAPATTEQLAHCIALLEAYPWMREKAFAFLSGLTGSAWPYVIARWDELVKTLDGETGCSTKEDARAPQTYRMMHELVIQRCDKPFCSHPKDAHDFEITDGKKGDFIGRCTVPGCVCGFFRTPRCAGVEPAADNSPTDVSLNAVAA